MKSLKITRKQVEKGSNAYIDGLKNSFNSSTSKWQTNVKRGLKKPGRARLAKIDKIIANMIRRDNDRYRGQ